MNAESGVFSTMLAHDIVPSAHGPTHGWCLVLHGLGDSRRGWQDIAPMLAVPGLGFVFAQAPIPYGPGWSWFGLGPQLEIDLADVRSSRALLAELIAHVQQQLRIGPDRLALLGFSQGCLMALDAALRAELPFAQIVGISGFVADIDSYPAAFGAAARQQRILWTHGHFDGVIPIAATRRAQQRLASLGLAITWREYDKDHGLDPEHELDDIRAVLAPVGKGARPLGTRSG